MVTWILGVQAVLVLSLGSGGALGFSDAAVNETSALNDVQDVLHAAMNFFEARGARQIVAFQCTPADKAALFRLSSDGGVPVKFQSPTSLREAGEAPLSRTGVFVNVSCPGAPQAVLHASGRLRFNSSYAWFLFDPLGRPQDDYNGNILDLARNLSLSVDSILAILSSDGVLLDAHKAYYDLPLEVTPLARVTRRTDLTGVAVRAVGEVIRGSEVGWNQFPQYLEGFIRDEDPSDIYKHGPRLFDLARQLYNFTFVMRSVSGSGSLLANGSCSGIPGLLARGEFDFALQLWQDEARMRCVQYVAYNLITFEAVLVYRMPTRSSSAVNSMITPFSSGSWAGVFFMFGMMALLLLIADEFHLEEAFGNLGPWSAALIFGTAGISWGSIHYGINSTHLISVELGTVVGGLTYTVIFTYYQSSVVFGLLARDTRPPLSLRDVMDNEYRIVADDSAYFTDLFENTEDENLREIQQRYLSSNAEPAAGSWGFGGRPSGFSGFSGFSGSSSESSGGPPGSPHGFVSLSAGALMVKNEHVALVGDRMAVAKQLNPIMTRQQLCSVRYSEIHAERSRLFSAARREWPLADHIKRGLLLARERGLSRRIVRPFRMPCSSDDSMSSQTTISALTVTAATTAYAVLTIGYMVSGSFCALETTGPRLERTIDRFLETRRVSVLFTRRTTRKWSRISGVPGVPSGAPSETGIQFIH